MHINVSLSAKAVPTKLMPDLPAPGLGSAYCGPVTCRPDLIYRFTESGVIPAPASRMVSVATLVARTLYSDYSPEQLLAYFKKHTRMGDLQGRKVLAYVDRISEGVPPIMAIKLPRIGVSVMDGNHRLAAAYCTGVNKIKVYAWEYKDLLGVMVREDQRRKPTPVVY